VNKDDYYISTTMYTVSNKVGYYFIKSKKRSSTTTEKPHDSIATHVTSGVVEDR